MTCYFSVDLPRKVRLTKYYRETLSGYSLERAYFRTTWFTEENLPQLDVSINLAEIASNWFFATRWRLEDIVYLSRDPRFTLLVLRRIEKFPKRLDVGMLQMLGELGGCLRLQGATERSATSIRRIFEQDQEERAAA